MGFGKRLKASGHTFRHLLLRDIRKKKELRPQRRRIDVPSSTGAGFFMVRAVPVVGFKRPEQPE
jgi:hypothetical protein